MTNCFCCGNTTEKVYHCETHDNDICESCFFEYKVDKNLLCKYLNPPKKKDFKISNRD